jgi:leucine efflux protein
MHGIQHYSSFVFAVLVFQAIPGAGTLAILNATARGGTRAGIAAALGTMTGDLLYMMAAAAGLASVLHTYPEVFRSLQWFGAGYLCWLGYMQLRARAADGAPSLHRYLPRWSHFCRAFAVSLTNPKVMLFFVAFFPLFLQPTASAATLATMMVHVVAISFVWQVGLAYVGNAVAVRLRGRPTARLCARRVAGCALVALGLELAAGSG